MRLYLAGPMSNIPEHNFPAFTRATAFLRDIGHDVVSPHEMQEETFRLDGPFTRDDWHRAMRRDFEAILTVEAVVLLPGHEASEGCRAEVSMASALGLLVTTYDEFILADHYRRR